MKKLYTILLVFQLPLMLLAQQPFGMNATWTVAFENEYGYRGFRQISYSHDSIINSEAWQKFSVSGVTELRTGPDPDDLLQDSYSGVGFGILYLTRNDSVFRMDQNGNVNLSFDYNAQVGDQWQVAPWDTSLSCVDTPFVTVTAIGVEYLNGKAVKYWDIVDPMDSINPFGSPWYGCSSASCMAGRVYENIGAAYSSLYTHNGFYNFKPNQNICGMPIQLPSYYLRCYQDDSISVNFTSVACDAWNWLDVEESTLNTDFKIYPNPNASGHLTIESLNEFNELTITSVSGQMVFQKDTDSDLKESIEFDLESGLYFVQLKNKRKLIGLQKLRIQ